jgi:hypothetical protein
MPLSPPECRKQIHARTVLCTGYLRTDELWDIEDTMTDAKSYPVHNDFRSVEAGAPFHHMAIRLRVDDALLIHAVEVSIDAAPHRICPSVAPNFQRLIGLRIEAGFLADARRRVGGVCGCTHLVELLGPLATTAIQTILPMRGTRKGKTSVTRPSQIGTCHALAPSSEVVAKYWPSFRDNEDAVRH